MQVRQLDDSHLRFSFFPDPPKNIYPDEMFPLNDLEIIPSVSLESMECFSVPSTPTKRDDLTSSFTLVEASHCFADKETTSEIIKQEETKNMKNYGDNATDNNNKNEDGKTEEAVEEAQGETVIGMMQGMAQNGAEMVVNMMTSGFSWFWRNQE